MELHLKHPYGTEVLRVSGADPALLVNRGEDGAIEAEVVAAGQDNVLLDRKGARHLVRFYREGGVLYLHLEGALLRVQLEDPDEEVAADHAEVSPVLRAPMPGRILEILTGPGAAVSAGDPLVRMEAMKMEIDVPAQVDGVVGSISVAAGDLVDPDAELLRIDTGDGE